MYAGLIGYRAYAMTSDAKRLGLYGFGAAAHIIAQVARQQGKQVYAFTRAGDLRSQQFTLSLGALVPQALRAPRKGATVVCAGYT